jgi:hypothetical protein
VLDARYFGDVQPGVHPLDVDAEEPDERPASPVASSSSRRDRAFRRSRPDAGRIPGASSVNASSRSRAGSQCAIVGAEGTGAGSPSSGRSAAQIASGATLFHGTSPMGVPGTIRSMTDELPVAVVKNSTINGPTPKRWGIIDTRNWSSASGSGLARKINPGAGKRSDVDHEPVPRTHHADRNRAVAFAQLLQFRPDLLAPRGSDRGPSRGHGAGDIGRRAWAPHQRDVSRIACLSGSVNDRTGHRLR